MNYSLEISSDSQTITVKVTCLLNQDIRKEILLDIACQLARNDLSKVIIDLTESTFNPDEPMVGAMDLTDYMRSIGIGPDARFAFVYSEAESHRKYFEHIAQLDGFNIRYFKDMDAAVAWLG